MSNYPQIIALSGKKSSGKSSFANILNDLLPSYEQVQFAGVLKQMTAALTGCDVAMLEDQTFKQLPSRIAKPDVGFYTYREIMQLLGTDLCRNGFSQNVWVDALFARVNFASKWIVTDCRFPNEADAVQEEGGCIVRIERPGLVSTDNHPSETSLDQYSFEHVIINDGTLDDLREKVIAFLLQFHLTSV